MPKNKRNHESSRSVVCLICRYKIFKNGQILKDGANLTTLIRTKYKLLCNYDPSNMTFPNSICPTCRISLNNCMNDSNIKAPFIKACSYINSEERPAMHTRMCSNISACDICITARQLYKPSSRDPCHCSTCAEQNVLPPKTKMTEIKSNKTPHLTHDNLIDIQADVNLSDNQIIKVASRLQSICGRKFVDSGFRDNLAEISHKVEQFYSNISSIFL